MLAKGFPRLQGQSLFFFSVTTEQK